MWTADLLRPVGGGEMVQGDEEKGLNGAGLQNGTGAGRTRQ